MKINGFLLTLILLLGVSATARAEFINPGQSTKYDYSSSAGKTITCNITAMQNKRIAIWSILASTDKSSAKVTIQKAAAAGTTTNYSTIAVINAGTTTAANVLNTHGTALFVGQTGYSYKLLLDSTTANALIVNYDYE
jgi:hypothetical protein